MIFGGIEDLYLEGDIYGNITRAKILNYLSFLRHRSVAMQREGTVAEPTIATGHAMQIFNDYRNVLSLLA